MATIQPPSSEEGQDRAPPVCGLSQAAERGGDLGGGGAVLELRARGDGDGGDSRFGGIAANTVSKIFI